MHQVKDRHSHRTSSTFNTIHTHRSVHAMSESASRVVGATSTGAGTPAKLRRSGGRDSGSGSDQSTTPPPHASPGNVSLPDAQRQYSAAVAAASTHSIRPRPQSINRKPEKFADLKWVSHINTACGRNHHRANAHTALQQFNHALTRAGQHTRRQR